MSRAARHRRPRTWRPVRAAVVTGALVGTVAVLGTTLTDAAFTAPAAADLGPVGGAYAIALVGPDGTLVPGHPDALVVDDVVTVPDGGTAIEVGVVTTTAATGPVTVTVRNGRTAALPTDPGMTGPGADPFDVGLFTVLVDGEPLVESVPGADLQPVVIDDWATGVPRTVQLAVRMPAALGNPYYYGRAMVVGLQLDGSTS